MLNENIELTIKAQDVPPGKAGEIHLVPGAPATGEQSWGDLVVFGEAYQELVRIDAHGKVKHFAASVDEMARAIWTAVAGEREQAMRTAITHLASCAPVKAGPEVPSDVPLPWVTDGDGPIFDANGLAVLMGDHDHESTMIAHRVNNWAALRAQFTVALARTEELEEACRVVMTERDEANIALDLVSGALTDAATVPVPSDVMKYEGAIRFLTLQRDAALDEVARLENEKEVCPQAGEEPKGCPTPGTCSALGIVSECHKLKERIDALILKRDEAFAEGYLDEGRNWKRTLDAVKAERDELRVKLTKVSDAALTALPFLRCSHSRSCSIWGNDIVLGPKGETCDCGTKKRAEEISDALNRG